MTKQNILPTGIEYRSLEEIFKESHLDGNGVLAQQVYRLLRKLIVELKLLPNQFLPEKDVADGLGISKTPVREAFIRLAEDGLVRIVPKSGTYVAPIDLNRACEGYLIRNALESMAAAQAAIKCTPEDTALLRENLANQKNAIKLEDYPAFYFLDNEFHDAVFRIANMPHAKQLAYVAKVEVDRVRSFKLHAQVRRVDVVLAEHAAVVDSIVNKDDEGAKNAMGLHLSTVNHTIADLMKTDAFWDLFHVLNKGGTGRKRVT